jgi:hypothetical protein
MLSSSNLRELDEANLRFIVGSKVTKAPKDLASHFRWHGDAFTDGQIIDTLTPKHAGRKGENDPLVKAEPGWEPGEHPGSWRAVWAYSAKRAAQDADPAGEPRQGRRRRREGRPHPTVRQDQQRLTHPGRGVTGQSKAPRRPEGIRHEHPRRGHASR